VSHETIKSPSDKCFFGLLDHHKRLKPPKHISWAGAYHARGKLCHAARRSTMTFFAFPPTSHYHVKKNSLRSSKSWLGYTGLSVYRRQNATIATSNSTQRSGGPTSWA
jgi:hypothetical protein